MPYDAFISYSHGADAEVASAIEQGLERLARPWNRLRAMSVFRDQTELSPGSDLSGAITRALDDTRFLVLLASPESARSPWVDKEVAYWFDRGKGHESLIVVVTAGEFAWDEAAGRPTESSDSVSAAMRSRFITEPLYVDLRWSRDANELSLRDSRFRSEVVRVAAKIRGMAPADLESEDVRLYRRARRLARGAVATVLILALVASVAAVVAAARARDALGRQLGLVALDMPASEVDRAFLLSLIAARLDSGEDTERFQASRALIGRYSRLEELLYAPEGTASISGIAISPAEDRTILAATAIDGRGSVLSWEDGVRTEPTRTDIGGGTPSVWFTRGGIPVIGAADDALVVLGDDGSQRVTIPGVVAIDTFHELAATWDRTSPLQLTDISDGKVLAKSFHDPETVDLRFGRLAATSRDRVVVLAPGIGSARSTPGSAAGAEVVGVGPDDATAAVTVSLFEVVEWRRQGNRLARGDAAPLPAEVGKPHQLVVSRDGKRVLVVGETGLAVVRLEDGAAEVDPGATGTVTVDPSGRFAAVGGARFTIWDLDRGRPAGSLPRPVNAMAWSDACGQTMRCTLATVGESLDAWRPELGRHVELVEQTNAQAIAISHDGATVVTAGWGPTVAVWGWRRPGADDSSPTEIDTDILGIGDSSKCGVVGNDRLQAMSPDGSLTVTHRGDDGTLTVCETGSGSRVATAGLQPPLDESADAVAVDDSGNVVVAGAGHVVLFRREGQSFETGRAIDVRQGGERAAVTSLAYQAGTIAAGIRPAAANLLGRVFVWPVDEGGTPAQFETDHLEVPAVALLGDAARWLVVASRDGPEEPAILEVWETATFRRVGRALHGLSGEVVAMRGDESAVVAADSTGKAYRWELDQDPTHDICAIVGRSVTDSEWKALADGALVGYSPEEVCTGG